MKIQGFYFMKYFILCLQYIKSAFNRKVFSPFIVYMYETSNLLSDFFFLVPVTNAVITSLELKTKLQYLKISRWPTTSSVLTTSVF